MKILWAIEPTHQERKKLKGMYNTLSLFADKKADIEVGMVVTQTESWLSLAFDVPLEERFTEYPKSLITKELKGAQIPIAPGQVHVIDFKTYSTTKAVGRLLEWAHKEKKDLVALYTHAKKGFEKFLLGSFSETMLHLSDKNLLMFGPHIKAPQKIERVLLALDFSDGSLKPFKKALGICKHLKAELLLFHHAEPIYKWAFDEEAPEVKSYRQKVDKMKTRLLKEAETHHVTCKILLQAELRPTSNLIIKAAEKHDAQLVALVAKGGSALMGGSVTRQVVRISDAPVLVLK